MKVLVINQQMRNPNRPSLTKQCPCNSGKLHQKCCGSGGGSGMLIKEDEAFCLQSNGGCGQFIMVINPIDL